MQRVDLSWALPLVAGLSRLRRGRAPAEKPPLHSEALVRQPVTLLASYPLLPLWQQPRRLLQPPELPVHKPSPQCGLARDQQMAQLTHNACLIEVTALPSQRQQGETLEANAKKSAEPNPSHMLLFTPGSAQRRHSILNRLRKALVPSWLLATASMSRL